MYPIFFEIFNIKIYTYGFFVAMGFLAGITLAKKEALRLSEDPEKITDLCFYILLFSIIGARIFYVFTNPELYIRRPLEIFKLWNGGLVFYGGFLAALVVGIIYVKKHNLSILKTADILSPSIALGHFIGRIGCFFAGCCYGRICELPWAVRFTHEHTLAPAGIYLHPTQIYSALSNLIIFIIIMNIRKFKKLDGQVFLIYVMIYGIMRSIIEIFRGDFRGIMLLHTFSISQLIGITASIIAGGTLLYIFKKHKTN
jgi:phosphatidylglycerol---prolipoprotein diacylglyceryl transferase